MSFPKAYIKLNNLRSNIKYLQSLSGNAKLYPVIKADAYGHGAVNIAHELANLGIECVCVATYCEIEDLVKNDIDIKILHLGRVFYEKFDIYFNQKVILTINSIEDVQKIECLIEKYNKPIKCYIKVDTGMNRMGCDIKDFDSIFEKVKNNSLFEIQGVYSHLSSSGNLLSDKNSFQFSRFIQKIDSLKDEKLKFHILNTGGLLNYSKYSLDIVRPGISIYGISPIKLNARLKSVMEFKAPVVHIKKVSRGESVGYDCKYVANKDILIAIVQCGYADGMSKDFENKGVVFYKDYELEIIGKISMDLFAIDCTGLELKINDEITIWGGDNLNSKLENIAKKYNTIPYVYLTNLSKMVVREYV